MTGPSGGRGRSGVKVRATDDAVTIPLPRPHPGPLPLPAREGFRPDVENQLVAGCRRPIPAAGTCAGGGYRALGGGEAAAEGCDDKAV